VDVKNILNTVKKGLKAKIYSLQGCQDFKSEDSLVGKSIKEHKIINFPHKINVRDNSLPESNQEYSRSIYCYKTGSIQDSWTSKL
jgi:hypothetical protein